MALVDKTAEGSLINQRVGKIVPLDPNNVNLKFAYYFLSQKLVNSDGNIHGESSVGKGKILGMNREELTLIS
ncbi:hypothetical protein [Limisalsivibrio acetivorans]|uniref:hypothetical protein n=1 Tax=Limisalsivibrio acetivorans TaxID=1304888 RepID=UPI0003B50FB0|nr:hypothetical protein [Limisalsivibrio acetivorans]